MKGDRALILTYLDSPMAEVPPPPRTGYIFFHFGHLQEETGG